MQDSKRDTDVSYSLLDSVGEGGGMIWENGIKTCTISYKKRIASPILSFMVMIRASFLT